ncbi:MAG: ABC transporter ATP-binding protein [Lachnospiraceae bacterium]|nr:ABC transporter ATP-binding protein [Lachnospiraceae bacterium]
MIKIENLQKRYDNFLLDCSLEVKTGSITGLIGQNGAGKSTTFKAILGLVAKDAGSIRIFGKDIETLEKRDKQKIGVALSDSGFSGWLTIKNIIPIMAGMYDAFHKDAFLEKCREFQLPLDKKLKEFSTGMKAKLKVLVAISHEASLLILDEPTAGLDVVAREQVLDMLRSYMEQDEERAILISSHISSDLEGLCDDIYMIHEGKIVLHEETDVLLDRYAVLKVDEKQYEEMDKRYVLKVQKENFGYKCLTNERQFYQENYPSMVIEKGTIDELIMIMIRGEKI